VRIPEISIMQKKLNYYIHGMKEGGNLETTESDGMGRVGMKKQRSKQCE
jgi:hypothetical protein